MQDTIAQSTPWFAARTSASGTTCTVAVGGEIDLAVAQRFEAAVAGALADEPRTVVVDLGAVDFMDSSGIHVLLRARERAAARSLRLVVLPGPERVQRMLAACGVDRELGIGPASPGDGSC